MKIDKILVNNGLPPGEHLVAALANRDFYRKKWKKIVENLPYGLARCRSLYTHDNIVILYEDAEKIDIPIVCVQSLKI